MTTGLPICPLCGGTESTPCFSERGYDVVACHMCDLFFIHPYGEDIHKKVSTYDYEELVIIDPERNHAATKVQYRAKYFSNIVAECAGASSLLDVGCGTAPLLELMHEARPDMHCVGIELNIARAQFARKVTNCEVYQVPVEEFTYASRFDAITLINVLSHIPSLDHLFASIRNLLNPGGRLILKVGEMTRQVRRDAIFDWGIPDHLHFLGMGSIGFICDKYHFDVVRHTREPLSADLFSRFRWTTAGRSAARNLAKRTIAGTPFALALLRAMYERRHKDTIYSSFVVLTPR